ncbi:TonB family protein [Methylobacter sp. YRD-M1]|uniref:TonB family protein n=1 Tax=Methylobacter sp. YRD-M1 TaxID=2911520 RepID=UPI00227B47FD|nr:TonB family protein [Methylobacter sp. YRD-M1]WAK02616.1 TonB family protein [Methylobacter sp. YRD-M1]
MNAVTMFDPPPSLSNNDSLLITLFLASVVHIVLILGISFSMPKPEKVHRSIDIVLVNAPAKKAPKEAKFLAQENQIGAGEETQKPEPPKQQMSSQGASEAKPVAKKVAEVESKPKAEKKVVVQKVAEKRVVTASKPEEGEQEPRPRLSAESLQQQIAQLGTEIRQKQESADNTGIKFVNQLSAHKAIGMQYMKDWESKVERTGNLNYPEVAAKKNFSATLTMDVGISADGSIYSMRINRSSGNPALDEAAKNIVKMSAPFPPLPAEVLKETKVLVIPRVWKFSDESGMTSQ